MEIVQGDDYNNSDGRAFSWSSDDWPDLTGATLAWAADNTRNPAETHTAVPVVVAAGGGTQTIRLELTAAITGAMEAGSARYNFHIRATLAGGRKVTLISPKSTITVLADRTT
ncbi:MAG: hypothetical protein L0322_28165 [Chloroflexi bacterium]|nr:hypothetical protein [Chloroflexota bacterium]MCI0581115.1 hypothetical protein [Chloroflexota bacterium]MCI0648707.1 hypothetical protein [Chloroflexota bacterium]